MSTPLKSITHEHHLDHMVKVVPLLALGYGLQAYFLWNMGPSAMISDLLVYMAFGIVTMVSFFVTYDLKHQVHFYDQYLTISFPLRGTKTLHYSEIEEIQSVDDDQSFGTIMLRPKNKRAVVFYFVDNVGELKKWIEQQKQSTLSYSQAA